MNKRDFNGISQLPLRLNCGVGKFFDILFNFPRKFFFLKKNDIWKIVISSIFRQEQLNAAPETT